MFRRIYDKVNLHLYWHHLGIVSHCLRHDAGHLLLSEAQMTSADGWKGY